MADQSWSAIAVPLLLGGVASFSIEMLLKPRPLSPWQRPLFTRMLHLGIWLLLYAPLLMLFRRPWFASTALLALLLLVVLVSNAKFNSLFEPFIFQDFSYFVDALRYPRLYLPFLGVWSGLSAILAVMVAVATGLLLEKPLALPSAGVGAVVTAVAGAGLILLGCRGRVGLLLEPSEDLARLGLPASLLHYALAERQSWQGSGNKLFAAAAQKPKGELPNLVVIQSESFFDPRRWISGIAPELLQQYDALKQTAVSHGQLEVPAWGANTVRTEFAFLSAIANDQLGIHRFKPYRRLARQGVPTLAGYMKGLGYRTVCLHPYTAKFYDRERVFPLLGFDEFIDISRFTSGDYAGQYVGDAAVAREVCRELALHDRSEARPLFLFVITMENHGPLHLEQAGAEDGERFHMTGQPEGCADLTVYLRHLEQADRMLGAVREQLESMERGGWLCLFGDHLPIMPDVYRRLGEPDGTVDYLVWSNDVQKQAGCASRTMKVEQLAELMVGEMGLLSNK